MANDDHIARWKNRLLKRRKRQGLCKLPADAIVKARDDTAAQVNLILLTFVGTVIFCVLSLLTPDSALLIGGEKLNVPLAGPVSFADLSANLCRASAPFGSDRPINAGPGPNTNT